MTRIRPENNQDNNQENLNIIQPVDEAVSSGVDRLMDVIEQTVENLAQDEAERQMLRQGVTAIVQDTLLDFLRPQNGDLESTAMGLVSPINENLALGVGEVTDSAIDSAVRGSQQVGMAFVDFTQGLITGTFNSIIKATIDQMKAYTDMVAELTKSLKEFAADNVSEDSVTEKLAQLNLAEKQEDGTLKSYKIAIDEPRRGYHLKRLYYLAPVTGGHRANILKVFGLGSYVTDGTIDEEGLKTNNELEKDDVTGIEATPNGSTTSTKTFVAGDITTIRDAVRSGLAKDGMNQLRQMAKEGMARIVITEGEINTKLIFQVSSQDSASRTSADAKSQSFGGSVKAGASWGWGNASVNAYYNNMSVSTVDQTSVGNIETLTQMSGQVILKFKTDYKPLNDGGGSVQNSDLAPIV